MAQRVELSTRKSPSATTAGPTVSPSCTSSPPPSPSKPRAGSEARVAVRIPHRAPAQLVLWPAGPRTAPIDVQVLDYSRVGVGIVAGEIMLVGQKYVLREEQVTRGSSTCLYQVVRCDRRPDGRFSVGLRICGDQMDLEPREEPPRRLSRAMQWAYFAFALIGASAVLAYTLWRHLRS